jgi:hypothetical protein
MTANIATSGSGYSIEAYDGDAYLSQKLDARAVSSVHVLTALCCCCTAQRASALSERAYLRVAESGSLVHRVLMHLRTFERPR